MPGTKVFLTAFAITKGVIETETYIGYTEADTEAQIFGYIGMFKRGKDYFLTREEAVAQAEAMRARRIQTLQRTVQRLIAQSAPKTTPQEFNMPETLACPKCGSDKVCVTAEQLFMANTGAHYCHSVKTQDCDSKSQCLACYWSGERKDLVVKNEPTKHRSRKG